MKSSLIFVILGLLVQGNVWAQDSKFQIWNDFNPSYNFGEKWILGGDIGYRVEPATTWQSAYIRPGISLRPNKLLKFSVGVAYYDTWETGQFIKSEFRTFQFIGVSWPRIGGFQFKHRLGIEQRWFYLPEFNFDKYVNRSRYYLEVKSPKFTLFKLKAPFFVTANFEILRDINKNEIGKLADHNRYTLGVGNQISERFSVEARFKIINLVDPLTINYVREINVMRIRLYYKFATT